MIANKEVLYELPEIRVILEALLTCIQPSRPPLPKVINRMEADLKPQKERSTFLLTSTVRTRRLPMC